MYTFLSVLAMASKPSVFQSIEKTVTCLFGSAIVLTILLRAISRRQTLPSDVPIAIRLS